MLRMNQIDKIKELQRQGLAPQEIAGRLKLNRKTVAKYMKVEDFNGRALGKRVSVSKLDPWKPKIDEMPAEEKLRPLPRIDARPYRSLPASVSKTAFVEFDTNRCSAPSSYAGAAAVILALPDTVEVLVRGRRVATHPRLFIRNGKSELPGHREGLLNRSPRSKFQRIYELISGLGPEVKVFLENAQAEGEDPLQAAYVMFRLLRGISKETLLSAVREANSLKVHKIKFIRSLLESPGAKTPPEVTRKCGNNPAFTTSHPSLRNDIIFLWSPKMSFCL